MKTDAFDNLCTELTSVQKPEKEYDSYPRGGITTPAENKVKYHVCIRCCDKAKIYAVDHGLLAKRAAELKACDWLVLMKGTDCSHGCFVELKKGSGEDAILQLRHTLKQFDEKGWLQKINKRYAHIVANSMPMNTGKRSLSKAQQDFRTQYKCDLQHVRRDQIKYIDS